MKLTIFDRFFPDPRHRIGLRFDRQHGVETTEVLYRERLTGMPAELREHAGPYIPTNPDVFERIMRKSGIDPTGFTFVDLGCGKGRILIAAAAYPFQEIVGVEADSAVYEAAQENVRKWQQGKGEKRIRVVHGDARTFPLPKGNLFVFMYSPFIGPVFEEVARRLGEAAAKRGRAVVIAYSSHWEAEALERTKQFTRRKMRRRQFWGESTVSFFYNELANKLRRKSLWKFGR